MIAHTPPPTRHLRKRGSKAMGVPIEEASFDLFLEHQIPRTDGGRRRIDKHFRPQAGHLAAITYTDVIPIERLAPAMKALLGDDIGGRYFDRRVNATAMAPTYHDPEVATLPARALRERYRESGRLPDKASFLGGGRDAVIRDAYAEDDALYRACRAHDAADPVGAATLRVEPREAAKRAGRRTGRKRRD
jgi:hypothetical protein